MCISTFFNVYMLVWMCIYTSQKSTYSYFIRSVLKHPPALPALPALPPSWSQKWEPHVWGVQQAPWLVHVIGEMAMRMCHVVESWYSYSSLWLARPWGTSLLSVLLKVWEFLLATDFALLAEHISNTIQKGSEIPELPATLCPALDLGAGSS